MLFLLLSSAYSAILNDLLLQNRHNSANEQLLTLDAHSSVVDTISLSNSALTITATNYPTVSSAIPHRSSPLFSLSNSSLTLTHLAVCKPESSFICQVDQTGLLNISDVRFSGYISGSLFVGNGCAELSDIQLFTGELIYPLFSPELLPASISLRSSQIVGSVLAGTGSLVAAQVSTMSSCRFLNVSLATAAASELSTGNAGCETSISRDNVFYGVESPFYNTLVPGMQARDFTSSNNTYTAISRSLFRPAALAGTKTFTNEEFIEMNFTQEQYSYIQTRAGDLTITSCTFTKIVTTRTLGSCVHHTGSKMTITQSTFVECVSTSGGGAVYANSTTFNVTDCTFNRTASQSYANLGDILVGGGMYLYSSTGTSVVDAVHFLKCNADIGGAMVLWSAASVQVSGCLFEQCTASRSAAGLCIGSAAMISKTTTSDVGQCVSDYLASNKDNYFGAALSCMASPRLVSHYETFLNQKNLSRNYFGGFLAYLVSDPIRTRLSSALQSLDKHYSLALLKAIMNDDIYAAMDQYVSTHKSRYFSGLISYFLKSDFFSAVEEFLALRPLSSINKTLDILVKKDVLTTYRTYRYASGRTFADAPMALLSVFIQGDLFTQMETYLKQNPHDYLGALEKALDVLKKNTATKTAGQVFANLLYEATDGVVGEAEGDGEASLDSLEALSLLIDTYGTTLSKNLSKAISDMNITQICSYLVPDSVANLVEAILADYEGSDSYDEDALYFSYVTTIVESIAALTLSTPSTDFLKTILPAIFNDSLHDYLSLIFNFTLGTPLPSYVSSVISEFFPESESEESESYDYYDTLWDICTQYSSPLGFYGYYDCTDYYYHVRDLQEDAKWNKLWLKMLGSSDLYSLYSAAYDYVFELETLPRIPTTVASSDEPSESQSTMQYIDDSGSNDYSLEEESSDESEEPSLLMNIIYLFVRSDLFPWLYKASIDTLLTEKTLVGTIFESAEDAEEFVEQLSDCFDDIFSVVSAAPTESVYTLVDTLITLFVNKDLSLPKSKDEPELYDYLTSLVRFFFNESTAASLLDDDYTALCFTDKFNELFPYLDADNELTNVLLKHFINPTLISGCKDSDTLTQCLNSTLTTTAFWDSEESATTTRNARHHSNTHANSSHPHTHRLTHNRHRHTKHNHRLNLTSHRMPTTPSNITASHPHENDDACYEECYKYDGNTCEGYRRVCGDSFQICGGPYGYFYNYSTIDECHYSFYNVTITDIDVYTHETVYYYDYTYCYDYETDDDGNHITSENGLPYCSEWSPYTSTSSDYVYRPTALELLMSEAEGVISHMVTVYLTEGYKKYKGDYAKFIIDTFFTKAVQDLYTQKATLYPNDHIRALLETLLDNDLVTPYYSYLETSSSDYVLALASAVLKKPYIEFVANLSSVPLVEGLSKLFQSTMSSTAQTLFNKHLTEYGYTFSQFFFALIRPLLSSSLSSKITSFKSDPQGMIGAVISYIRDNMSTIKSAITTFVGSTLKAVDTADCDDDDDYYYYGTRSNAESTGPSFSLSNCAFMQNSVSGQYQEKSGVDVYIPPVVVEEPVQSTDDSTTATSDTTTPTTPTVTPISISVSLTSCATDAPASASFLQEEETVDPDTGKVTVTQTTSETKQDIQLETEVEKPTEVADTPIVPTETEEVIKQSENPNDSNSTTLIIIVAVVAVVVVAIIISFFVVFCVFCTKKKEEEPKSEETGDEFTSSSQETQQSTQEPHNEYELKESTDQTAKEAETQEDSSAPQEPSAITDDKL